MFLKYLFLCLVFVNVVISQGCYWNRECAYQYYSSKTPYDTVRGDIRDYPLIEGCEAVSVWVLNRHGNRNPGTSVTLRVQDLALLKDEIITSYENGRSQLCAQDIDLFRDWTWNSTLVTSTSYLTGVGYEEIFDIAYRIREKYPHLLINSSAEEFYVRPTNEQRTITSAVAFIHGLAYGTGMTVTAEAAMERDDVVRPYENCNRYQAEVRTNSTLVQDEISKYMDTEEFDQVTLAVNQRLGITTQITKEAVYDFYELCRFDRSWNEKLQSPWCSVFSNEDLVILEYRDDVRHYYRNGYGHWINQRLGGPALNDLYNTFLSVYQNNQTRKLTSYFSHDTMLEMAFAALGLYKDPFTLYGDHRDESRTWRSSFIGAFSTNIIAVLNRCNLPNEESHKVQFFINEKETDVCPQSGCSWSEFQEKFSGFSNSLDFCAMDYPAPDSVAASGLKIEIPRMSFLIILLSYLL